MGKKIRRFFHRKRPSLDVGQSRPAGFSTTTGAAGEVRTLRANKCRHSGRQCLASPRPLQPVPSRFVASNPIPHCGYLSFSLPIPSYPLFHAPFRPAPRPTHLPLPRRSTRQMPPWVRQGSGSRAEPGTSSTRMHLGVRDGDGDGGGYGHDYEGSSVSSPRRAARPSAVRKSFLPFGLLLCSRRGGASLVASDLRGNRKQPRARTLLQLLTPFFSPACLSPLCSPALIFCGCKSSVLFPHDCAVSLEQPVNTANYLELQGVSVLIRSLFLVDL